MTFFLPQNPGIGGLDELTDAEALTIQNLASLGDPNADRILFWDDSAGAYAFLTVGSGLSITDTTLTASAGTIDGSGTTNELVYWVDSNTLGSLAVATYPTLAELAYVKGVTSAIQTQLNAKAASLGSDDNYVTDAEKIKLSNLSGTNTGDQTNISGNAATVTTNANLTGHITSTGNVTALGSFTLAQLNTAVSDADIARTDATNTFTGLQTYSNAVNYTNNAITASGNAATVPITARVHTVTNNSAATLTITLTTTSAVDGQLHMIRILDASAATQTITWVNTENSTVTAPTTSNGSTTLPLTVGFQYNSATSKWRCIASA